MWHEFRFALRQLTRYKRWTLATVGLLGVGIGASATVFQFVNAVVLRSLPVRDADNLFLIQKIRPRQVRPDTACFYRLYEQIASRTDIFSSAIAVQQWTESSFQPLTTSDSVKMVSTEIVSPNYFTDLGISAALGRGLTAEDAHATSDIPIVLSYRFWASQMNGDPAVIGRMLRIKDFSFRIVGVLPKGFNGIDIDRSPDIRLPISAAPVFVKYGVLDPRSFQFAVFVRLKSGYVPSAAAAATAHMLKSSDDRLARMMLGLESRDGTGTRSAQQTEQMIHFFTDYRLNLLNVTTGVSSMREQFSIALYVLLASSVLLFVAVSASVAGLFLVRFERTRRELAIRAASGASRGRLSLQVASHVLVVALPGTILAWLIAVVVGPRLLTLLPKIRGIVPIYPTEQVIDLAWDSRSMEFMLLLCLFAVVMAGVLPVWRSLRLDINDVLKRNQGGMARTRVGGVMVAAQVALCIVLLYDASLMFQTFWTLKHLNPGFDRAHIVAVEINPAGAGYSQTQTRQTLERIRAELSILPGVKSVAGALMGVMHGVGMKATLAPQGLTLPPNTFANVNTNSVTPTYFEALGIPLLVGRTFNDRDRNAKPQPVVINKAFADLYFPNSDPIGRGLVPGADGKLQPTMTIVGVVGTAKYRSLREESPPIVYQLESDLFPARNIYIRTANSPDVLIRAITKLLAAQSTRLPIISISTLEQEVENSLWQERLVTLMSVLFALIATGLAAAGIYATLAHHVDTQIRDVGIRIALGAKVRDLIRALCRSVAVAVLFGLFVGMISAAALARFGRALIFGVQDVSPSSLLLAALAVVGIAAVTAIAPVRRAVQTNPAAVIRSE